MGLVYDDEVPIRLLQFGLDIFIARKLVESADREGILEEPVSGAGRLPACRWS